MYDEHDDPGIPYPAEIAEKMASYGIQKLHSTTTCSSGGV
jgi:hypothetical protein